MSDALNYLLQARPEALGHYFAFLKDCGKHLDPKTRALISVITKVDAQTAPGFRQYLKRALAVGCSPLEVLDALLMAFPTLGLSKIVWAVDIIRDARLPGFDAAELAACAATSVALPAAPQASATTTATTTATAAVTFIAPASAPTAPAWHPLLPCDSLAIGHTRRIDVAGRGVFVHRASACGWKVFDSRCPHQGTDIPAGAVQGDVLTCPLHAWAFDVRSGACRTGGGRALTLLPSRVRQGQLFAHFGS